MGNTLLGDLDVVADYLEHHNVPTYMDAVVARLREAEKRLRDALTLAEDDVARLRHGAYVMRRDALVAINGGTVKP